MDHRGLRFFSLLLTALGLVPGAAHLLEMPVKLGYTPELYFAVTSTLYALYGSVGAVVQVTALVSVVILAFLSRRMPASRLVVAAASLLALSLVTWGVLVAPVNGTWGAAIKSGWQSLPDLYADLRLRWEYGHAAAFTAWFAGYCFLQWFVLSGQSRPSGNRNVT